MMIKKEKLKDWHSCDYHHTNINDSGKDEIKTKELNGNSEHTWNCTHTHIWTLWSGMNCLSIYLSIYSVDTHIHTYAEGEPEHAHLIKKCC